MAAPDMDVIKEIPGYKVILKAVLKSQIQQLVEQLASSTDEESVILTASVSDGTLCHLGSDSGKVFLEDHEDIKSQFLGFCLKRHHTKRQEKERQEAQEREEALARSMQAVTPPRYGNMGPRQGFMPQRSQRYPSPRQQHGIIPVAMTRGPSGPIRSPGNRHQPYPMARPQKPTLNFDQQGRAAMPGAMRLPVGNRIDGQVIKIEPDEEDDDASNQSAGDTSNAQTRSQSESRVNDSSQPSSPSAKASTPSRSQDNDDAKSDTSSSTIPNEASDLGLSDTGPPGGLSLDSDLSNLISDTPGLDTSVQSEATGSESNTQGELDSNVSVKLEAMADSEMDLEITGVELGQRPMQETMGSQEWLASVQNVMQGGASGSSADLNDQQAYNSFPIGLHRTSNRSRGFQEGCDSNAFSAKSNSKVHFQDSTFNVPINAKEFPVELMNRFRHKCSVCGKIEPSEAKLQIHIRKHTGERPFQCEICAKSFANMSNKRKHMKVKHREHLLQY